MKNFETVVLENLVYNEQYCQKIIAFVKEDYFKDEAAKLTYSLIHEFVDKYQKRPTTDYLQLTLSDLDLNQDVFDKTIAVIDKLESTQEDNEWLVDETEKWAKEAAVYNGIIESIGILDNDDSKKRKEEIPEILSNALAISLDDHVGHDYIDNSEERWESYHEKEDRIPFDLEYMNKITNGGLSKKTLNIIMAETGGGKSLFMCHMAAGHLALGKSVLYITLEMSEEKIAKRIDANLLDIPIKDLDLIGKDIFDKKINKLKTKGIGKLVIKEYPTSCAGAAHFRYLLKELMIKKRFAPDIIYIDYLNICSSSRLKPGSENSYHYVKSIAEELRGLGQEKCVPIVSASQLSKGGYGSDPDITNTSESMGLPFTADVMWALIRSEELDQMGQVMIKQFKNRDGDMVSNRRGIVGLDITKMRFHDVAEIGEASGRSSTPAANINNGSSKKDFSRLKI